MVAPLKNKSSETVIAGLESVFRERTPHKIHTDRGKEYTSNKTEAFFRSRGIEHFVTDNAPVKANYAERVIRTIRNRMYRYFNHKQSYKFIDILSDLVRNYNETPHSSLHELAPRDVTPQNEVDLLMELYFPPEKVDKKISRKTKKKPRIKSVFKFKVGIKVRISHLRQPFTRDFHETFTGEIFTIVARYYKQNVDLYKLEDYNKRTITGSFYAGELLKLVNPENLKYRID
ncbi:uncharacterized protein LOC117319182 [Pecten maximus]|uniref:uncharacterized protein LOC117319182 n=1 Tax=Pecten maximus TaxID=6579 RepID=UPI0014587871|nr:uncharacterized protein LOC117319182 [Pecten maximus]